MGTVGFGNLKEDEEEFTVFGSSRGSLGPSAGPWSNPSPPAQRSVTPPAQQSAIPPTQQSVSPPAQQSAPSARRFPKGYDYREEEEEFTVFGSSMNPFTGLY